MQTGWWERTCLPGGNTLARAARRSKCGEGRKSFIRTTWSGPLRFGEKPSKQNGTTKPNTACADMTGFTGISWPVACRPSTRTAASGNGLARALTSPSVNIWKKNFADHMMSLKYGFGNVLWNSTKQIKIYRSRYKRGKK